MENKLFINFQFSNNDFKNFEFLINGRKATLEEEVTPEEETKTDSEKEDIERETIKDDGIIEENIVEAPIEVTIQQELNKKENNFKRRGRAKKIIKDRVIFRDYKNNAVSIKKEKIIGFYETKLHGRIMTGIKAIYGNSVGYFYCPTRMVDFMKLYY